MHDNDMGAIMNITLSFDEKFLLSVGKDGNFFVYSFMDEEKLKKILSRDKAQISKQVHNHDIVCRSVPKRSPHFIKFCRKLKVERVANFQFSKF